MSASLTLATAPLIGAALGFLFIFLRDSLTPLEIWHTSNTPYKVVTLGSVLLSSALLTTL